MRKPVRTKRDFVHRYKLGEFGNRSPTWETIDEWLKDTLELPASRLYHVRNRLAGGPTWYNLENYEVGPIWYTNNPSQLYISAMAPTPLTTFQGEIRRWIHHYDLRYSLLPSTMREALAKEPRDATGVEAVQLLRRYLDPSSYDDLIELLDEYDNHVIEFSCYATVFGTIPNRNTVFWEVRLSRPLSSNLSHFTEHF